MIKLWTALVGSWLTAVVLASAVTVDPTCSFADPLPPSDVLIGYIGEVRRTTDDTGVVRVGAFRPLGILRIGTLVASDGASIQDGMKFWQVLSPSDPPTALRHVSSFLDRVGEDHCVFHGEPAQDFGLWTLLSSRPLPAFFSHPSASDRAYFAEHRDVCVDQGDYDPHEKPPCSRPQLLAVSDLDGDGAKEYWATEPYMWDTGISVWQRATTGVTSILSICTGCSD